jgi:hypothetical protein
MPDGVKSLIAGAFLVFMYLVVYKGEIHRRGVTFCHNFVDVPVLQHVPCLLLDVVIGFGTILLLGLAVVGFRRLRG